MRKTSAGAVRDCGRRIAAMRFVEVMSAVIRNSRNDQLAVVMLQNHMLIQQDLDSQAAQLGDPGRNAAVVLMVAGHEVRAVTRRQASERRHVGTRWATLPSTRSPVTATMSACSRFTAPTIDSR